MATKVWPSTNDVGGAGAGKVITESNLTSWIKTLVAQNFVVSGFTVPASSTTLNLDVAAGEAILSGYRVVIDAATTVTCTASATNHIYLQLTRDASNNVTEATFAVNTTGTAPADSVKIATAVADATSIISTTDARQLRAYAVSQVDGASPDQTQAPASPGTGTLAQVLSWLANRIKAITGAINWWDAPALTLAALSAHKSRHAAGGADVLTPADIGAVNKAGDTMTGTLSMGTGAKIDFADEVGDKELYYSTQYKRGITNNTLYDVTYQYYHVYDDLDIPGTSTPRFEVDTVNNVAKVLGNTVWHAGNDGAGSGLDADLFKGRANLAQSGSASIPDTTVPAASAYTLSIPINGPCYTARVVARKATQGWAASVNAIIWADLSSASGLAFYTTSPWGTDSVARSSVLMKTVDGHLGTTDAGGVPLWAESSYVKLDQAYIDNVAAAIKLVWVNGDSANSHIVGATQFYWGVV